MTKRKQRATPKGAWLVIAALLALGCASGESHYHVWCARYFWSEEEAVRHCLRLDSAWVVVDDERTLLEVQRRAIHQRSLHVPPTPAGKRP